MKKETLKNENLNENLDEAMQEIASNGGEVVEKEVKETSVAEDGDDLLDNLTDPSINPNFYYIKMALKPREVELQKVAPAFYFKKKNREGKWETQKDKKGLIKVVKAFSGDVSDIILEPYIDSNTQEEKTKLKIYFTKNLGGTDCTFCLDSDLTYPVMAMINSILSLDEPIKTLSLELYANYNGDACVNTYPNNKSTSGKKGMTWKYGPDDTKDLVIKTKVGKKDVTDDSGLKEFFVDHLQNHKSVLFPGRTNRKITLDSNKSDELTEPNID